MQRPRRAAYGLFVVALFMGSISTAQAQDASSSSSDFDTRFHFQPNTPQPDAAKPERIPDALKGLLVSPAEAEPAPIAPPAAQHSESPEAGQTSKNSSLHKRGPERPIAVGRAAYYEHSGRTASGEIYNPDALTAAHKSLALGTRLRVVNLRNGKSVIVKVTDRSPAKMKFAIDLSRGSARAIGVTKRVGTTLVAVYKINDSEASHE
jgi:rare lipoprotein A